MERIDILCSCLVYPKNKKPAAESENKRRKRTKGNLIRLDELIPDRDVKAGTNRSLVSLT
jgi:hypothetical protein